VLGHFFKPHPVELKQKGRSNWAHRTDTDGEIVNHSLYAVAGPPDCNTLPDDISTITDDFLSTSKNLAFQTAVP